MARPSVRHGSYGAGREAQFRAVLTFKAKPRALFRTPTEYNRRDVTVQPPSALGSQNRAVRLRPRRVGTPRPRREEATESHDGVGFLSGVGSTEQASYGPEAAALKVCSGSANRTTHTSTHTHYKDIRTTPTYTLCARTHTLSDTAEWLHC